MSTDIKQNISTALQGFSEGNLFDNAIKLFSSLGYKTERQSRLSKNTYKGFIEDFPTASGKMNLKKALPEQWKAIELLFQLTQTEMTRQSFLFDTGKVDNAIIEAYLFFAIELTGSDYTRTQLSDITRELNKVYSMPVMVLFKYGNQLTLSVIKRRLHKKDESKDVLEKVTLIKDISIEEPHRAHIEILFDLSFDKLQSDFEFRNFVELHNAWQKTLDSSELNKRFYKELANWYFWAVDNVEFPDDVEKDREKRNSTNVIRMLTRLIFVWFLKEKDNLIPDELFNKKKLDKLLDYKDKNNSTYYKAILQNLFFATLNTEMNKDVPDNRTFVKRQYGIQEFYRYERFFKDKEAALKLFENIPFLNGGLFENLDKNVGEANEQRIDCFSNNRKNEERLSVPDFLFFETEKSYDKLNKIYDTSNKKYVVRGLLEILNKYKFTIHENTPIEEEIALDPELLGKVFENLLASYNEETKTTARKLTGSFYTPREVVNYMVEESLIAYLKNVLTEKGIEDVEEKLRDLFSYNENEPQFTEKEKNILIEAIDTCKIVDPACGSGAYPMGILHKMVFILSKLDPHNERWMQRQIDKVYDIPDTTLHDNLIAEIKKAFNENYNDYGRKLYLIENCIYGVDIQPIAVQIAKLRFFISLIVDQKVNRKAKNLGIRPLPNLETKFVAANTLIGIERPNQLSLRNADIDVKEKQLHSVRERHFNARTPATKKKYRERDKELRKDLADLLEIDGFKPEATRLMASWDPYDQNKFAGFFDSEWMFGLQKGFDVVIGNPPYGIVFDNKIKEVYESRYPTFKRNNDIYVAFFEASYSLLSKSGILNFITPNTYLNGDYFKVLRNFLREKAIIHQIVDFKNSKIFQDPTVFVSISILQKAKQIKLPYDSLIKISNEDFTETEQKYFSISEVNDAPFKPSNFLIDKIFSDNNENKYFLMDEMFFVKDVGFNYWSIGKGKKRDGDSIGDRILYSGERKSKKDKSFLKGKNIEKYIYSEANNYLRHDFEDYLESGVDVFRYSANFLEVAPKIIYRQTSNRIIAAVDFEQNLCDKTVHVIVPKTESESVLYLLALLNSQLFDYFYKDISQELEGRTFAQVKTTYIKKLPVIKLDKQIKAIIENIVFYIIALKKSKNESNNYFERLIDAIVYELYFPESIKAANAEVIELVKKQIPSISEIKDEQEKLKVIEKVFKKLNESNNEIRNRIIKQNIAVEEVKLINQSLSKHAHTADTPEEL